MKCDLATVGRPRWTKFVGRIAGELLKTSAVDSHLVDIHVAGPIGIESEPLTIRAQSYYLDALGGGRDVKKRRDGNCSRSRERQRPDADVRGPGGIGDSTVSSRRDSVDLESRCQSLGYIVRAGSFEALIIEISPAASVRDVENPVAIGRPNGTDALMQRVREQRRTGPVSADDPYRRWRDVSELRCRVDE